MTPTQSDTKTSTTVQSDADFEQLAQQVDQAMAALQSMPPELRIKALAIKSAIEAFHKVGLTHIVRTLKADTRGKELLFELVAKPEVYALFSMHGLVRADLKTQVSRVIEMVRPYMQSHGGDVALVDIRDRIVLVELTGSCHGCSMSQVTLKKTVEDVLKQHIPEITGVEVASDIPTNLVQIRIGSQLTDTGWVKGPRLDDVPMDEPFAFSCGPASDRNSDRTSDQVSVLLIRTAQGVRAYRNTCAHQGLPLDGGMLDAESGTLTCPWHGFRFDTESGECLTAPQCQLEAFPLRIEENHIWVRPEVERR